MLAQNFKSNVDLGISEAEWNALRTVLGMLERGECGGFDMHDIEHRCGTPSCILGWGRHVAADRRLFNNEKMPKGMNQLFFPDSYGGVKARPAIDCKDQSAAATALRNYLRTGKPNWAEALG